MDSFLASIHSAVAGLPAESGGSGPSGSLLLAILIRDAGLREVLDLDTDRGIALLSMALAVRRNGQGAVVGVEPRARAAGAPHDPGDLRLRSVRRRLRELDLESVCTTVGGPASDALQTFERENRRFDLVRTVDITAGGWLRASARVRSGGFLLLDGAAAVGWSAGSAPPSAAGWRQVVIRADGETGAMALLQREPARGVARRGRRLERRLSRAMRALRDEEAGNGAFAPLRWLDAVLKSALPPEPAAVLGRKARILCTVVARVGEIALKTGADRLVGLVRPRPDPDRLVILDDAFPHLLTSFRIAEFNAHLERYPGSAVYSTGVSQPALSPHLTFHGVWKEYARRYPRLAPRVHHGCRFSDVRGGLAYATFLHNARTSLPLIERHRLPFAFTLYPGGGFFLDDPRTDEALRRVLGSPWFRKVVVTQPLTRDYLLSRGLCPADRIEFVFGVVLPADRFDELDLPRKIRGKDKDTIDACFVAHKYMPGGVDKGYDVFLATARILASRHPALRFHVVGPFSPSDGDLTGIEGRIRFHGSRPTSFFGPFYAGMDLILSPNAPFLLRAGSFDGFPTGCCAEAGLCGTAVFCTDELRQNVAFEDGRDLVIVPRDAKAIAELVDSHLNGYEGLVRLGERGRAAFRRVYDLDVQMQPRWRVLDRLRAGRAD